MKILMLVNWKIEYCKDKMSIKQPPDYYTKDEPYWFFRHFTDKPKVDVIDISSFPWLEKIEKNRIRFYIWQTFRCLPVLKDYDLIISHGMQSGIVLSFIRLFWKTKAKHIVFDIGSFNSAAERGTALKLMQFASKSIDCLIYHTSSQVKYYKKYFPWLVEKSEFVRFGADSVFFDSKKAEIREDRNRYIICVGYTKRDWETLIKAYQSIDTDIKLRLVGYVDERYEGLTNIEQLPFVSIGELITQICNAKFCVLPLESFNYSYGQMTLLQQMALGKCIVAARVPSLVDYIKDGENAVLYEAKNVQNLATKIDMLLHDEEKILQVECGAQKFIFDICNECIMAEEIEKILKKY